ncbi:hypothetical protein ES288_1Z031600v1 [Gossypium darwinii]|uniref:F-box domain-containing protein n=1 Tax=Gossypium darwinii TaxID=34276 RepID=A0A5C7IZN2_GOSDA|nr:hypothetical protein ES288_1Z031600v1 [Gossypium darwinii]
MSRLVAIATRTRTRPPFDGSKIKHNQNKEKPIKRRGYSQLLSFRWRVLSTRRKWANLLPSFWAEDFATKLRWRSWIIPLSYPMSVWLSFSSSLDPVIGTGLALRCSRKSISLTDDSLLTISIRCRNLTRLKLRGCREITDEGMSTFAKNSKKLRKLSCGSCMFGAKALNALSVKRLRGIHDGAEPIGPGAAASSLKMICLKELVNGQSFAPLVVGSKNLKTLKIIPLFSSDSNSNPLMEIHLERLQVSDIGLSAISKCTKIENLHILKPPTENCKLLRKLHIDGWRTNRIGDEGLIAVAKHCSNLQELVLIGVNATHVSLSAIACNCSKLERLALCGSGTIGDTEIACIAAKCMALKKLCIKGCPISDIAIEALGSGCPNLVKIKVRKCRGVSSDAGEWLREQRGSMLINMDACDTDCGFEASVSDIGVHETGVEVGQVTAVGASTSSNGRLALLRSKLGHFAGRNLVACTLRRWSNFALNRTLADYLTRLLILVVEFDTSLSRKKQQ